MENKKHNRLIHSLSPYLKQHAYNPVDWYEWGDEAFEKAEAENKLVLLSIGYSACHWCHVMAHECFEDEETAALMNAYFVCVKIDREEYPDVDRIYMDACQLVNGNGGWPLNAFVLPDKRPIHALTYAPKLQWQKILHALNGLWTKDQNSAFDYAEKLSAGIRNLSLPPDIANNTIEKVHYSKNVFSVFQAQHDPVYGGPKRAPKFPMPCNQKYLLEYGKLNSDKNAIDMALFTLKQMALGGIYDCVEGGFSRYSVDERWFAPHFEKMLYDNAQLIEVYSYAYALSNDELYKKIALETIAFCKQDWLSDKGIYYSALDADSEGVEGLYYTYTFKELQETLGEDVMLFSWYFQCTPNGNWEHNRNILYAIDTLEKAAETKGIPFKYFKAVIDSCLDKLRQLRSTRVKPGLDDKCICSWNALQLKGLSDAAIFLQDNSILDDAIALADSMQKSFQTDKGLKRISKEGVAKIDALLEDYALYIDALIALYQATLNEKYLLDAYQLCELCMKKFYRENKGFFIFNSDVSIVADKYDINDDVINSGNSTMAQVLRKLSWYFDKNDWREISYKMLESMRSLVESSGPWYSNWAALQSINEHPCMQYILAGDLNIQNTFPFKNYNSNPNALFGYVHLESKIPLFQGKKYSGVNTLYICEDMVCGLGINFNNSIIE